MNNQQKDNQTNNLTTLQVTRKDIDQNNAVITLHIEQKDYQDTVANKLAEYKKKANMPGFRPGKVPMNLIKKMYEKNLKAEAIDRLIVDSLYNYIETNKIKVLGSPIPTKDQPTFDFDQNQDFTYSFDIGIAPTLQVEISDKDTIDYYQIQANDEMIENQKKSYQQRFGKYQTMPTVEENDMVKGQIQELENGEIKENGIQVSEGVLTPAYIKDEDIKKTFIGANTNDTITFNPKKAYQNDTEISSMLHIEKEQATELNADFQITIKEITRFVQSELNQELYDKAFGEGNITTEEEFIEKIKQNIQENLQLDADYKFLLDTKQYLLQKYADLTLPDELLKRWLQINDEKLDEQKIDEQYPKMAEDLKWQLIKDQIAEQENIQATADDIKAYAIKVSKSQLAQYGMTGMGEEIYANYAQEMLKNKETVQNFHNRAIEDKIIEKIKTTITQNKKEISMEDFNKMFENQEA